jgi:capsular polysaccharide transport system permease protein
VADAVNSYILSRDIVKQLEKKDDLRNIFARDNFDFINRFPNFYQRDDQEQLCRHYLRMVDAAVDQATGINSITVVTFRPEDSRQLANAILLHSEELINRLNDRMVRDTETYAQSVVARAKDQVVEVSMRLAAYRNAIGSVDPSRESAVALDQIAHMTSELAELQAALQQQRSIAPASPALPAMQEKIRTFQDQIEKEKLKIVGTDQSLTTKLAEFEKLTLDSQLAARELDSALAGLTAARQDAQRQHLYLQRITEPNLADEARYPKRILTLIVAIAGLFAVFAAVYSIYRNIMEHRL